MPANIASLAIGLAAPAAAHVSLAVVQGITTGRGRALSTLLVALISVVIGWRALARASGGAANARSVAVAALVAGLGGVLLSALHLATAAGAIGTGSGRLGAIVALLVGLLGTSLGGLALSRARRAH